MSLLFKSIPILAVISIEHGAANLSVIMKDKRIQIKEN